MRVRNDFVTNSSSSNFIIAYKDLPIIDDETLEKYPFLSSYRSIIKTLLFKSDFSTYDTEDTEVVDTKEELMYLIKNRYRWEISQYETMDDFFQNNEYIKEQYDACVKELNKGYKILSKRVGYGDIRNELFNNMKSDDFKVISKEEY